MVLTCLILVQLLILFACSFKELNFSHISLQAVNDGDVQNIVLSYLVHNCYKETAESFTICTGLKQHTDYLVDMEKRKSW